MNLDLVRFGKDRDGYRGGVDSTLRFRGRDPLHAVISAALYVNIVLFVFHLMPIPGLDGARILARFLPPRARAVYTNLDQYLVLIMLVVFFIFAGPLLAIVGGLTDAVATVLAGSAGCSL